MAASDLDDEYVPVRVRKKQLITQLQHVIVKESVSDHKRDSSGELHPLRLDKKGASSTLTSNADAAASLQSKPTLLATSQRLRAEAEKNKLNDEEQEIENVIAEEQRLLDQVQRSMNAPLMSVKERAKGIVYTEPLQTDWRLPRKYREMSSDDVSSFRELFFIDVNGENIPPPVRHFAEMRLPQAILTALDKKGIKQPSQIQMQGLPAAFQGRDLIGIAFTGTSVLRYACFQMCPIFYAFSVYNSVIFVVFVGSGKTIVFALPMILFSLEAELRAPFVSGEGPYGLVVCPSRELALQTSATVEYFIKALHEDGYPLLRCICMIGGTSVTEQVGFKCIISTNNRTVFGWLESLYCCFVVSESARESGSAYGCCHSWTSQRYAYEAAYVFGPMYVLNVGRG